MFVAGFVEEMDFIGGGDGDGGVDGDVGDSNANDALMIALEIPDLSL